MGKGSAQALRALSAQVWVTEIDPINALQAAMEGYQVVTMEYAADKADIFVTATGNKDVITHDHMAAMKDQAIVCNIGHFDNEIDVASLEKCQWEEIKPQVDHVIFPDGKRIILLAKGRLVNLGCGTGHPSFVMSAQLHQPDDRADRAVHAQATSTRTGKVYVLPKHLDEKVARLHLKKLGAQLTELTEEQAAYIGVRKSRPVQARHVPVLTPEAPSALPQGATHADRQSRIRRVRLMELRPRSFRQPRLRVGDPDMKSVPISFEFFPPNTPVGDEKLKDVVRQLGALQPEFFSVTYGAGGSTRDKTLHTVRAIAEAGFEAAPHLSCVGSTRAGIAEILDTYRAQKIHRLVALRGDLPSGTATAGEFRYAAELVRFVRETQGADWHIEVAAYPEYHPEQRYSQRDLQHYVRQGEERRRFVDHAVLLQRRRVLPLRRQHAPAGRRCAGGAGHHALPQLRQDRPVRGARRHRDPALGGAEDGRLHGRCGVDPRLRPGRRHRAVRTADRRRRAGHPLLHDEPGGADAGAVRAACASRPLNYHR